jgi:CRP-like cAMP-binding protein
LRRVAAGASEAIDKSRLLDLLPRSDRDHLLEACTQVELKFAEVIREPGERIRHVYFPINCSLSLIAPTDARTGLEIAVIGNEGVLGVSVACGIHTGSQRTLVTGGGSAWRLSAAAFCSEFERSPAVQRLMTRYIYVVLAQFSQAAVCTNFHDLGARLARWLLVMADRSRSEELDITQQLVSSMLGVRREGITLAASALQKRKLIRYARGHLTILDRDGLQAAACACYPAAKKAHLLEYPGIAFTP